jgi:hypothetical protein
MSKHARGELLNGIAVSALERGDLEKAERYFRRVTDELPRSLHGEAARDWLAHRPTTQTRKYTCLGCH